MRLFQRTRSVQPALVLGAAALATMAVFNLVSARRAERRHPPEGRFIEVNGVRLHYTDRGTGEPIVLLHGNAVTGHDYDTSGVVEALLRTHRVIIFDRPGFGHSSRPRGRVWTATRQAALLRKALATLEVRRPVVVGHSWGTLVALEMALAPQSDVAGLVLLSGYYFPSLRLDALLVAPVATPVLGDLLRWTVSPLAGWLQMPLLKKAMFSPAKVTPRFDAEYSPAMALRPSQVHATAADGAMMVGGARRAAKRYGELEMPVTIIAGDGDKVVGISQARRLQRAIPGSELHVVEGVGHMVHHVAVPQVASAIVAVTKRATDVGLLPRRMAAEPSAIGVPLPA